MGKAENYVEGYLYKQVKKLGGMCLKFTSGIRGVPDRIVILNGQTIFVETKAKGESLRRLQIVQCARMRAAGADVREIDTREQVDALMIEMMRSQLVAKALADLDASQDDLTATMNSTFSRMLDDGATLGELANYRKPRKERAS